MLFGLVASMALAVVSAIPTINARPVTVINGGGYSDQMISGKVNGTNYFLCLNADQADLQDYPTTPYSWVLMNRPNDSCRFVSSGAYQGNKVGAEIQTLLPIRGPKGHYFFSTAANNIFSASYSGYVSYPEINVQQMDWHVVNKWNDDAHHLYSEGAMWNWKLIVTSVSSDTTGQNFDFKLYENSGNNRRYVDIVANPVTGCIDTVTNPQNGKNAPTVLRANNDNIEHTIWTMRDFDLSDF